MLTAVVTRGATTTVHLTSLTQSESTEPGETAEGEHSGEEPLVCEFPETDAEGHTICGEGPSPILPEAKEFGWAAGSFFVLSIVMVGVLVPKVMKGMKARYDHIQDSHEQADSMRAAAKADVAQYESSLSTVKAEAHERVEAARRQLESERADKLAEANAAIAARRDAANAEAVAARHAVNDQINAAVQDVTTRTLELGMGKAPSADVVRSAVDSVMTTGVAS